MPLVDGLQSAVMYRTGKLLHGCATVFVLHPLIIYVVSTTLLLAAEGARASPSQRDIKEAEKIVGRFLRNEAGTTWLSGLAKTRSAPLTTQDLMKEILEATRPGGKVWQAASILSESLKDQALNGIKTESVLGQAENWKDLIAHIENQDDIICLYRKNTEETAKKADDWKKFLRTVSPGYTVHLAIDTGRKYVICLKKIDVPETTPEEILTTQETLSTVAPFVDPSTVTVKMTLPTTPGKQALIPASGILKNTNNTKSNVKPDNSDENCDDKDLESTENIRNEDSKNYDDIYNEDIEDKDNNNLSEEGYDTKKPKRGMEDDLSAGFGDYPINLGQDWRRPVPPSIKRREFSPGNNGRQLVDSPPSIPDTLNPWSSKDPECNRPIILVVQNGNTPLGYRPGTSLGIPIQQNLGAAKLPWFPSHPWPFPTMPPKSPLILRHPAQPPQIPGHPFVLSNTFPQFPKPSNLGKPIVDNKITMYTKGPYPMFSQNTHSVYKLPRGKKQKPVVKSIAMPFDIKSLGSDLVKRKSNIGNDLRYPFENYMPRKMEGFQGIPNSLIRKRPETTQRNAPARNIVFPRRRIPDEANLVDYNLLQQLAQARRAYHIRQFLQNYKSPQLQSQLIVQKPVQLLTGQTLQPLINTRNPAQSTSRIDRELLGRPSPPPFQGIDPNNQQLINLLRQNPPVQNLYQSPYSNLNPNYPTTNNFVKPNVLNPTWLRSPFLTRLCPIPMNTLYALGKNNPSATNSLTLPLAGCNNPLVCPPAKYPLQGNSVFCPSPCDRPIKLQIMINGNVQEPLKVSVISEPGQRVEIVGNDNLMMPYGSRALGEGAPLVGDLGDEEVNIHSEAPEVKNRMHESEQDTEKEGSQKKKGTEKKVSSVGSTSDRSEKVDDEHNSTTESRTQAVTEGPDTEGSEGQEIGDRFLHEGLMETSSRDSVTEVNTTLSATTNSTIVE